MAEDDLRSERVTGKIIDRVERKFDKGNNHFMARGIMAKVALAMTVPDDREIIQQTNNRITDFLQSRNAEGIVYAVRQDLGNGLQDSTDYVGIYARNGERTSLEAPDFTGRFGRFIIVRVQTPGFDDIVAS